MIAFLLTLTPYIPVLLQVVGLLISWFGTSKQNLDLYAAMITQNKDSGKISAVTAQRLSDFHKQMVDDYNKRNGVPPVPPAT